MAGTVEALGDGVVVAPAAMSKPLVRARRKLPDVASSSTSRSRMSSRATVDIFHAAAVQAGGTDNGAPGVREVYHPSYYGAYVLDPDGNNIEAVCHALTDQAGKQAARDRP
jgi:hypothetical protein